VSPWRKEYREWVQLLVAGVPLPGALPEREDEVAEDPTEVTALDEATCEDYIRGVGDWAPLPLAAAAPPPEATNEAGKEGSEAEEAEAAPAPVVAAAAASGRGLHSFTSQLNLSAFMGKGVRVGAS
jgi:hypothetical protein